MAQVHPLEAALGAFWVKSNVTSVRVMMNADDRPKQEKKERREGNVAQTESNRSVQRDGSTWHPTKGKQAKDERDLSGG